MKKVLRYIWTISLIAFLFMGLCGCETEFSKNMKRIFDTEYFRCINYEGEDTVTILTLTDKGKEQEILVIPDKINGYKVNAVGGSIRGRRISNRDFSVSSPKLRKVYLISGNNYLDEPIRIYVGGRVILMAPKNVLESTHYFCNAPLYGKVYTYEDMILRFKNDQGTGTKQFHIPPCNVFFHTDEGTPYWIDYISGEETDRFFVPTPTDREGERFEGWYTDEERETRWNEEYAIPEGKTSLELYAKWTRG